MQRLGVIKRCFTNRSANTVNILYKSIIRPVLEYGSPVWAPWHKKDITALDKVQAKCTKLCNDNLELEPLSTRRLHQDLVEVYKYLHGYYKTNPDTFFSLSQRNLRGHSLKLTKSYSRTDARKHFFSNRVVDAWNQLPEEVVTAKNLDIFKRKLKSLPPA